jgi:hypothetical protein
MFSPPERSQSIPVFLRLWVACFLLCGIATATPSITPSLSPRNLARPRAEFWC